MGTGLGNKKNLVLSLPPVGPPLLTDMNMKDVLAEKVSESGVELSSV